MAEDILAEEAGLLGNASIRTSPYITTSPSGTSNPLPHGVIGGEPLLLDAPMLAAVLVCLAWYEGVTRRSVDRADQVFLSLVLVVTIELAFRTKHPCRVLGAKLLKRHYTRGSQ